MTVLNTYIYDLETYKNIFTFCLVREDGKVLKVYEISDRKKDINGIRKCLNYLHKNHCSLVGFNNQGFDYPILHYIMDKAVACKQKGIEFDLDAEELYDQAQIQIDSFSFNGFGHTIPAWQEYLKQIDLFKIHHFDNVARATSLKMLEFNMRSPNIEDLPYKVGTFLNDEEKDVLIEYNKHDVLETLKFYNHSLNAIKMRDDLGEKFGINFTNHNDTKIGKDYFINILEKENTGCCYTYENGRKKLNRTVRDEIHIGECLFDYYNFKRPEFIAVHEWFKQKTITETKGVMSDVPEHELGELSKYSVLTTKRKRFKGTPTNLMINEFMEEFPLGWIEQEELKAKVDKLDEFGNIVYEDITLKSGVVKQKKVKVQKVSHWMCYKVASTLNVIVDGFRFDFGTGGLHGSVSNTITISDEDGEILDVDVASFYPNMAISNRIYPEHLGEFFCDIYSDVYQQRKGYKKGTPENAVMKLALNGVYGDSNNKFSPFFDSKYTMAITINGQLSLLMLAEMLMEIDGLTLIQVNTDGVTSKVPLGNQDRFDAICKKWEAITKLELEKLEYSKMISRDVNNYIAVYKDGKLKRKGAYAWKTIHHVDNPDHAELGWHQNHSALVIPQAAEAFLMNGTDPLEFIKAHSDPYDFMLRTKVNRASRLVLRFEDGFEKPLQNICRYYPSTKGGKLVKMMPPLQGETEDRAIGINTNYNVKTCNDMLDFSWDLDYDYYVNEVNKLIVGE